MTDDDEITLPPYPGIALDKVHLVTDATSAEKAHHALMSADILGFDTESKPIFARGQRSDGPHLIQLATDDEVFLFSQFDQVAVSTLLAVLSSETILKVGFGLRDDNQRLQAKLGIRIANVLDLSRLMRESKAREMGAKRAVAKYFGQTLQKSKKTSTSNWAAPQLNERQLKYAADDAQVALLVYRRWLMLQNHK